MAETRSWTDLSSNLTHLGAVRLADHLDELLHPGKGSPELTLGCLHEFTHHWCFHSAVGFAITGLQYRMTRAALSGEASAVDRIQRDAVAYQTVTAVLRPLIEGLALFAEFDANTVGSPVATAPMLAAINLFSGKAPHILGPAADGDLAPLAGDRAATLAMSLPISVHLRTIRVSAAGIRRKVNVLATGLTDDPDGYLLGYLGVKSMWRDLRRGCHRLYNETDLALAVLRGFFFEDRRLVDILLGSGEKDMGKLANRIVGHVSGRVRELARVTEADVARIEAMILDREPTDSAQWAAPLHVSPARWRAGHRAYTVLLAELDAEPARVAESADAELAEGLRQAFGVMLDRRHIVRLGTAAVEVTVGRRGRYVVRLGKRVLLRGRAPDAPRQSGSGTVELVFSALSSGLYRAIVVYGPESAVDIVAPGIAPGDAEEMALLHTHAHPGERYVELFERMRLVVDSVLDATPHADLLAIVQAQLPDVARHLYLDSALNTVPDDRLRDVWRTLDAGGVYALLDYDRDLLEALIVLGAVAPLLPYRAQLLNELALHDFPDPETILRRLVEIEQRTGFGLVNADDTHVLVHV
ncbi:hypothetical protein F3087_42015 [Nocardia colli]|uniref:Uncharacterized protein n=1 Tax=Nocardia colli TaxID=2545717 RepID=A0A5N0DTC0_9NOCA|nr:hypothetical protein [Nocardia colli]KAA8880318.1 hypothetical protein F3087_42015 [Nocardia colli]